LDATHLPDVIKDAMREYGVRPPGGVAPAGRPGRAAAPHPLGATETASVSPAAPRPPPPRSGAPTEAELRALLAHHRGNVAAVGREFGKERMQVHRWMKRYGIDVADYR